MRKKVTKLVFSVGVFMGGLVGGFTAPRAEAYGICPDLCMDADCTCILPCRYIASHCCICSNECVFNDGN